MDTVRVKRLEMYNINERSRKHKNTKVCLIWSVCRTGVCVRFHGENAPALPPRSNQRHAVMTSPRSHAASPDQTTYPEKLLVTPRPVADH